MRTLYHKCGQGLDVDEKLVPGFGANQFVFLDVLTGDGFDRCPQCAKALAIDDFTCQPKASVSQAKPRTPTTPIQAEGRRLIRKARAVIASRRVARVGL